MGYSVKLLVQSCSPLGEEPHPAKILLVIPISSTVSVEKYY